MDNKVIVTAYENPDLDGTACAYAYAEYLNKIGEVKAIPAFFGTPHKEALFVLDKLKEKLLRRAGDIYKKDIGVILVDASDLRGISDIVSPKQVIEIIDHRKIHEANRFPNAEVQIELVGAAATLVAERFYNKGVKISDFSATLLYVAIVSNTINFKANVTTDRDIKMAKWLKNFIKIDDEFIHEMFVHKSRMDRPVLEVLESDLAYFNIGNKKVAIAQLEIVELCNFIKDNLYNVNLALEKIGEENKLDYYFLTSIDIEEGFNIFVVTDLDTQKILEDIFGVEFKDGQAKYDGIIMRKEIVPLIKNYLENQNPQQ